MTPRQAAFVRHYLERGPGFLCATRAARLAGYAFPNRQGPALLRHPAVKPAIDEGEEAIMKACEEENRPYEIR